MFDLNIPVSSVNRALAPVCLHSWSFSEFCCLGNGWDHAQRMKTQLILTQEEFSLRMWSYPDPPSLADMTDNLHEEPDKFASACDEESDRTASACERARSRGSSRI